MVVRTVHSTTIGAVKVINGATVVRQESKGREERETPPLTSHRVRDIPQLVHVRNLHQHIPLIRVDELTVVQGDLELAVEDDEVIDGVGVVHGGVAAGGDV